MSLDVTRGAANELAATDLDLAVEGHKRLEGTIANLGQVSAASTIALDRIQRNIDAAMQALQFEDMLDQLLAAIGRKLAAIRTAHVAGPEGSETALRQEIERDVVTQRDVNSGTVDLL